MASTRARRKPSARGRPAPRTAHPAARRPSQPAREAKRGDGPLGVSEARLRAAAIWLAAFSSLCWIPGGFTRFVFAKLLAMTCACVVGALLQPVGRLPRAIALALAAGMAVFVVVSLTGETPVASLLGRWPRYEGVLVIGLYAAAAWLGARVVGRGRARMRALAGALAAMTLTLFVFSVLDALEVSPLGASSLSRSGSLLGNATDQGLVAMMALAVVAVAAIDDREPLLLAALPAGLVTVALSASRAALLLTIVSVVVIAVVKMRRLLWPAALAIAALVVAAVSLPETRERLLAGQTVRGRALQWDLTWDIVADHPWLGIGPSRYVDVVGSYETPEWVDWTGVDTFPDSPHNVVLQVLVAGGIPLLVSAIVLVVLAVRCGLRNVRSHPELLGLFVAVGAYGVAMLANFTIASSTCLAAFLAGALVAEPVSVTSKDARQAKASVPWWRPAGAPWQRWTVAAGFAACAVVLLMACIAEVRLQQGIDAARDGDAAAAEQRIESARSWRPLDSDIAMLGAQALAELANSGDPAAIDPALHEARVSLDRTPSTYASQVALAVALIADDDLEQARDLLDRTIAAYPLRPNPYIQRGIARFGLRDVAGARADLEKAADLAPDLRTPRRILDEIDRRLGR